MDGTLLDAHGSLPPGLGEVLAAAAEHGATVAPASGRQLGTLQAMFAGDNEPVDYIAENGTVVAHHGEIVSTTSLPKDPVHAIIDAAAGRFTVVVCQPLKAYTHPGLDDMTRKEIDRYYHSTAEIDDLHDAVTEDVVKVAVYTPDNAEALVAPVVKKAAPGMNTVISGAHWVDVMDPSADKGVALLALAEALGVEKTNTVAFGDYLNDYALLKAAGTAYAMDNAHPKLKAIADHIAPSNTDYGVITVLREKFGL